MKLQAFRASDWQTLQSGRLTAEALAARLRRCDGDKVLPPYLNDLK
jgi:hypothetical protein